MPVQKYDIRKPEAEGGGFEVRFWSPLNTPVAGNDGTVAYIIHKVEDVTEFVRLKQQGVEQSKLNDALHQQAVRMEAEVFARSREVAAASAQLKGANAELEALYAKTLELEKLKSQFFANVSHELRTPLTLIMGPLENRLRRAKEDNLSAAERRETEIMLRNARLLYRHVTDLLDAAKLESGRMTLEWSRVDFARTARLMAAHFESLARENGIAFTVSAPRSLVGEADEEKLQRILLNLLSNAFKFTRQGGRIQLRVLPCESVVQIEVEDDGPGIPVEQRAAIFERFRQVDGGSRRRHGGTGLGLAIVKDFVELHGGTVDVGEPPMGGALFRVALPLTAPTGTVLVESTNLSAVLERQAIEELVAHRPASATSPLSEGGEAPLVLVVEDNADMNEYISDHLRPHYRVVSACDGREGLDLAHSLHPDLILTDIMMPNMSGDDLAIALRREPEMADVPILMLTAKADEELRVKLLQVGVQDYLSKPFNVDELLARVGGLLKERKRTGDRLRASELRFEATFEQAAVGMAQLGLDGRFLRVNQKLCEMLCYSSSELLGKSLANVTHPDDCADGIEDLARLMHGESSSVSAERRYLRQDGAIVWGNVSVSAVLGAGGTPDYMIAVLDDITARKRSESRLRELSQAVEQSPESIVITDIDAVIQYVNDAFVSNTGYRREEVIGRNPRILHSGKTPEETFRSLWAALTAGRNWNGELYNRRKDGSEYVESAIISPIKDVEGKVTRYVAVKEDITEKKRMAEELEHHRQHLEDLVAQRTEELREAKVAAESATRAKGAFLANMSHEIRTPMNAIIGMAHLLRQSGITPSQGEQLDRIDRAARHLLTLINDILDLSKIDAGKLVLESIVFAPATLPTNVASMVSEQLEAKGLEFHLETGPMPDALRGDPTRLTQILVNLVGNAIKFTERGTITLSTRQIDADDRGVLLRFEVQDTGIGIPTENLGRLFGAFEQADTSTTRKYGGTGLGLSITKRLAEMMGGTVGVESRVGIGSTFWFTARLARMDGTEPTEVVDRLTTEGAEEALSTGYRGTRLLLAEDDPTNQEVSLGLLRSVGFEVDLAETGAQAVSKVAAGERYALILMDMQMPELDGVDAMRQIRALPSGGQVPILAMTANAFEEDRERCLAAGMNDFVAKPVDPAILFETLLKWLKVGSPDALPAHSSEARDAPRISGANSDGRYERFRNIEGFDLEMGLRSMRGNLDTLLRLLGEFSVRYRDDMTKVVAALVGGDRVGAVRVAHTLKGSAGVLGLTRLQEAAAKLEAALRDGQDHGEARPLLDLVAAEQVRVDRLFKMEPPAAVGVTLQDAEGTRSVLARLDGLLAAGDFMAGQVLREGLPLLTANLDRETLARLKREVDEFDYASALVTVRDALTQLRRE